MFFQRSRTDSQQPVTLMCGTLSYLNSKILSEMNAFFSPLSHKLYCPIESVVREMIMVVTKSYDPVGILSLNFRKSTQLIQIGRPLHQVRGQYKVERCLLFDQLTFICLKNKFPSTFCIITVFSVLLC